MLRPAVAALSVSSTAQKTTVPSLASRSYSRRSKPAPQKSDHEGSATKQWLAAHHGKPEIIPRNIAEIKRSTRNSKVMLRVPLNALSKYVSQEIVADIKGLSCYSSPSDKLTTESDEFGSQKRNEEECFRKVNDLVKMIGDKIVSREYDASLSTQAEELPIAKLRSMSWSQRRDHQWKKMCEVKKQRGQSGFQGKVGK